MLRQVLLVMSVCCALVVPNPGAAGEAVPTQVMVRAIAKDAKIIGTKVGGVRVTIRDAASGKVLAQGMAQGKTGDTKLIMVEPHAHGAPLYDTPGAAGYLATLMLSEPTVVEVIAEGPLGYPQSTQRASKTLLLLPGRDVLGDGVVLEIHGFTVEILEPAAAGRLRRGEELTVRARVTMT